jgi:cytochrome c
MTDHPTNKKEDDMKTLMMTGAIAALLIASQVHAAVDMEAGLKLARKSGCLNCHGESKKILGPSFQEIAQKYKGNQDAPAALAKKVTEGGSGNWGKVAMPPHKGRVNETDIHTLVEWALAH